MDKFNKDLFFGTAGIRGIIGKDIDIPTVKRITQGLADYINKQNIKKPKVVIGYDCRIMSKEYADVVIDVLNGNNIITFVFDSVIPSPMVSFAINILHCDIGIMITASHNTKEYNGYKIYDSTGKQISFPVDHIIENEINKIKDSSTILIANRTWAINNNFYFIINKEFNSIYINELNKLILQPEIIKKMSNDLKIVYTPLHGVGAELVVETLLSLGIKYLYPVEEQIKPDGNFPTILIPNPEDKESFNLAIKLAEKVNADIILANDPDADRIGLYVFDNKSNSYIYFSGNMIGALLLEYQLSIKKEKGILFNGTVIKTLVCSNLINKIVEYYGVSIIETLTGFKYIGEQIKILEKNNQDFIFGYEESLGYLLGNLTKDKDGILAAALICEALAYYKSESKTLYDQILLIYNKYGYYKEDSFSITLKESSFESKKQLINVEKINKELNKLNKYKINYIKDIYNGIEYNYKTNIINLLALPKEQNVYYDLGDRWFCFRFSGTEPKIKIYFGLDNQNKYNINSEINNFKKDLQTILKNIEEDLI